MRYLILALFALSYVGISARRVRFLPIGRPATAMVGAVAVVIAGLFAGQHGLDVEEALRAIEPHTIGLLLGMMVLAAGLGEAGFFAWMAWRLAAKMPSPAALLWWVTIGCGVLSAALVNDAVCLLATPLVVTLVRRMGAPLLPFLLAVCMGSNAGSALTLSGNPQNMLVAKLSGLSYRGYLADAALPALGALVITAALLHLFFRRALAATPPPRGATVGADERSPIDRILLVVSTVALVGVAVANMLGVSLTLSALAGGSVVILASRLRADNLLQQQVDWSVLLFFSGLFVLVAALEKTGLPAEWLADVAQPTTAEFVLVLAVGSQIVSNVPLILLLERWIEAQPDVAFAWTLTAMVTTLAGNLTLLGSVANMIVMERAKERLGFFEFLKIGLPVTLVSTAFAVGVLLLMR